MNTIDLTPYIAKGFPGLFDKAIAEVGVAGIDKFQTQTQIKLCPETEEYIYNQYSPTRIRYKTGSRPELEKIVAGLSGDTPRERALSAMAWASKNVAHPHIVGQTVPDRAYSEEQLVDSGRGWCNEQSRVFIALCEVMEMPARICFVYHENGLCGHTTTEVFLDGRWAFFDVTFNVVVDMPDGRLAEARELSAVSRDMAHAAYQGPLEGYYSRTLPYVEGEPGWKSAERPTLERGGDLLAHMGFCNYLIDGVEAE